jgi:Holliday junction resolvasome RuvABC endonuclease subunit
MIVLGLDLSTHTGIAVLDNTGNDYRILFTTTIHTTEVPDREPSDWVMVLKARTIAAQIKPVIKEYRPGIIAIEQTNNGKNRTSQKMLEFVHYAVLTMIRDELRLDTPILYIDTSRWRSVLSIRLSKDQKKHNKAVSSGSAKKRVTTKHLAVNWANQTFGLSLLMKDNNVADALALAYSAYHLSTTTTEIDLDKALQ